MEDDYKDMHEDINIEVVKKRAVSGVIFLTFRTFLLQIINFAGFYVILPLFITNLGDYGIYIVLSSVISFLAYFSDIGLAAALVQKKDQLSDKDLKTTFFVQQLLVVGAVILVFVFTPLLKSWQNLDQTAVYLLWALAISFLFSSLKTIPSVLLERKLDFGRLVIPQIVETILFNVAVIFFAWSGWGVAGFIPAVLIRGFSGLVLMYVLQPWKPGFALDKDSLKRLLKFGVPYQASTFLSVFKDDGMIIFLGGILGSEAIALMGLAKKWAEAPLRFFMDQVIKVTFPAFSRIQDNKEELSSAVTKSIFFICVLVFPFVVGLALIIPILIDLVPRYAQWREALLLFMIFSINTFFAAVTTPLTNLMDAIGKVKVRFNLMVMWTALTWIVVPFLANKYEIIGAAIGYTLVGTSSIVAIIIVRRYVSFDLSLSVLKPLVAAISMGVIIFLTKGLMPPSFYWVFVLIIFGSLIYFMAILLLVGKSIITDGRKVIYAFLGKK